ncbi:unnamed protein product [Rhizoctonia solani]|uniref:Protein mlo2 n=1 Tax=Rhizoctonia solani TaxID=456999 RepID=A0A8H3AG12_9AGAM|nr:unnamed protein product [Rhizoctonia solani]
MPSSHILAYPSVSSSLNNLQYQTNISNVPLHAGPHGRAAESEEMLKRGLSQTSGGPGRTSALSGMSSGNPPSSSEMLMMRDGVYVRVVRLAVMQDWFHESCLNLRERVPPRDPDAPPPTTESDPAADSVEADDASSVSSSTSLPPALLPGDTYETLVCGTCVRKIPTLKRYAGTKGVRMVVPSQDGFKIIGEDWEEQVNVDGEEEEGKGAGTKRRASGTGEDEQASKRPRADESIPASTSSTTIPNRCTAPPINAQAQTILADPTAYGDVFLSEGWRERWCRCETCYPSILKHPFLLEEEEIYEPPQDPDAGLSLEELGMRALATLPHERALDSIRAYNAMRDDLMLYLRPFADSGREVREEDITAFFQRRRQG